MSHADLQVHAEKVALKNLRSGNWNLETVQFFLSRAEDEPNEVRRMLGIRIYKGKS